MVDFFSRKHISELFGNGFFLDQCYVDYFSRRYVFELFVSVFFSGPVVDYFSWKDISELFDIFFSGPVLDVFSRIYIFELFGNRFFLDQCQNIFLGDDILLSFWAVDFSWTSATFCF